MHKVTIWVHSELFVPWCRDVIIRFQPLERIPACLPHCVAARSRSASVCSMILLQATSAGPNSPPPITQASKFGGGEVITVIPCRHPDARVCCDHVLFSWSPSSYKHLIM